MSNASEEHESGSGSEEGVGITDDRLPEDLQPGEDNPLAEGLEAGEDAGDLLEDGKSAETGEPDGPGGDDDAGEKTDTDD